MKPGTYEWAAQTPSDIVDHVPLLRWLASTHGRVVEFGVGPGVSTAAFRAARPGSLVSYDVKPPPDWLPPDWLPGGHDFRVADVLTIDPVECDLLFIDTRHVYEQLRAELERHAAGVTRTIALHDTHIPREHWTPDQNDPEGMWRALHEWLPVNPWEVVLDLDYCNGLTVLARTS